MFASARTAFSFTVLQKEWHFIERHPAIQKGWAVWYKGEGHMHCSQIAQVSCLRHLSFVERCFTSVLFLYV